MNFKDIICVVSESYIYNNYVKFLNFSLFHTSLSINDSRRVATILPESAFNDLIPHVWENYTQTEAVILDILDKK